VEDSKATAPENNVLPHIETLREKTLKYPSPPSTLRDISLILTGYRLSLLVLAIPAGVVSFG